MGGRLTAQQIFTLVGGDEHLKTSGHHLFFFLWLVFCI